MAIIITTQWCKSCGICVAFCPKQALSLAGKAVHNPDVCVECGMCERYCPDLAIELVKSGAKKSDAEVSA